MNEDQRTPKGAALEEVLRAFFLRAGFFVVRGVPLRVGSEDLTDVDLWLYERPTGTSRRIQICDIKYKQRPKAIERIFWTSGLASILRVDGAYVATTDSRPGLRPLAAKLNLQMIDGSDLRRIQRSPTILYPERIGDEQLNSELKEVDRQARNKALQQARFDILSSLSDGFGAPSIVRSLEGFGRLASAAIAYHPDSCAARAAGRLAFLAAAIACQSLDYISASAAFRPLEEKQNLILNAIRLGALFDDEGQHALDLALALAEKYTANGRLAIKTGLQRDIDQIPAEIIAVQAGRLIKQDLLFNVGRELERSSYLKSLPSFDGLSLHCKSMLGALLDYAGVDRERFASAWVWEAGGEAASESNSVVSSRELGQQSLFLE